MQVKLVRKKLIMRKDIVRSFRNVFPLKIHKLCGADLFLSNKMNKLIILLVWGIRKDWSHWRLSEPHKNELFCIGQVVRSKSLILKVKSATGDIELNKKRFRSVRGFPGNRRVNKAIKWLFYITPASYIPSITDEFYGDSPCCVFKDLKGALKVVLWILWTSNARTSRHVFR